MNEQKLEYAIINSNSNEDVPLYNGFNKVHVEDTKSGEKNSVENKKQKDLDNNKPRLRMI